MRMIRTIGRARDISPPMRSYIADCGLRTADCGMWVRRHFFFASFTCGAYNPCAMTLYDHTLAPFSRRERMKLAWMLGAAAVAPPILTRSVVAQPVFDPYPFTM